MNECQLHTFHFFFHLILSIQQITLLLALPRSFAQVYYKSFTQISNRTKNWKKIFFLLANQQITECVNGTHFSAREKKMQLSNMSNSDLQRIFLIFENLWELQMNKKHRTFTWYFAMIKYELSWMTMPLICPFKSSIWQWAIEWEIIYSWKMRNKKIFIKIISILTESAHWLTDSCSRLSLTL